MPSEPPGRELLGFPAAAFLCSPVWGCSAGGSAAAGNCRLRRSSLSFFRFSSRRSLKIFHRHMIHSGSTLVSGDLRERRVQGSHGMDLVDQAEPFASFDPLFEGRQHPLCPNPRFDPAPAEQDLSGTYSPLGHCRRFVFRRFGHCVSTFLHPFAPPALPGFFATMGALTPARRLFVSLSGTMNTDLEPGRSPCVIVIESSDHSVSNHLPSSRHLSGFFNARLTGPHVCGRPFRDQASLGLRHLLAGSPQRSAESSSLALRTNRSPPVALHPASRRRSYLWLQDGMARGLAVMPPCASVSRIRAWFHQVSLCLRTTFVGARFRSTKSITDLLLCDRAKHRL